MDEKFAVLNQTLINIFRNYISKRVKIKCDYRQLPWMTNKTKNVLKEIYKLTLYFYRNGQKERDHDILMIRYRIHLRDSGS